MPIKFGNCSSSLLYILITPIFSFLFVFFSEKSEQQKIYDDEILLNKHPFFLTFCYGLGEMIGGIAVLVELCVNKSGNAQEVGLKTIPMTNYINALPISFPIKQTLKFISIITLCTVLNKFGFGISFLSSYDNKFDIQVQNQLVVFQIIFCGLLSYPIIHYPIYRHQMLAITLILIGFGLISFYSLSQVKHWSIIIISLSSYFIWSFILVVDKWIMERMHISPYKLIFYFGVIGTIIQLILFIPLNYIPCNKPICDKDNTVVEPIIQTFSMVLKNPRVCFYVFLASFFYSIYMILLNIANKQLNPTHSSMSEILTNLIIWIYYMEIEKEVKEYYYYISILGYVVIIIGSLIYNEIILCYVCFLSEYTKQQIIIRGINDIEINQELTEDLISMVI